MQRAQGAGGRQAGTPKPPKPISPLLSCTPYPRLPLRPLLYACVHACCIWPLGARRAAKVCSAVRLGWRPPPVWPKGSGALRKRRRSRPIGESRPTGTTPHARLQLGGPPPLPPPPPRRSVGTTMSSCACRAGEPTTLRDAVGGPPTDRPPPLDGLALLSLLGLVASLRWHAITPRGSRGSRGSGVCAFPQQALGSSGVLGPARPTSTLRYRGGSGDDGCLGSSSSVAMATSSDVAALTLLERCCCWRCVGAAAWALRGRCCGLGYRTCCTVLVGV